MKREIFFSVITSIFVLNASMTTSCYAHEDETIKQDVQVVFQNQFQDILETAIQQEDALLEKHGCKPPEMGDFKPWKQSDYVYTAYECEWKPYPPLNMVKRGFIFESDLALNGLVYKYNSQGTNPDPANYPANYPPDYYIQNTNTDFTGPNPGIMEPFSYAQDWTLWGGDDQFEFGKMKYPALINHVGHSHIFTIHNKIDLHRINPKLKKTHLNDSLDNILNGSTQFFKWFAQLIDNNGNPIDYSSAGPAVQQITALMNMLITGEGTPGNSGVIDVNALLAEFTAIAALFGNPPGLVDEIDKLQTFLYDVLRINIDCQYYCPSSGVDVVSIPLEAWYPCMSAHQAEAYNIYKSFRKVYTKCRSSDTKKLNEQLCDLFDTGRKMAAFFGTFYSAISFLDQIVTIIETTEMLPPTNPAIPDVYRDSRVTFVHSLLTRYWMEHVTIFSDYDKCAALGYDHDINTKLYQIKTLKLQSCLSLADTVAEVFRAFDMLMRYRELLLKLNTL